MDCEITKLYFFFQNCFEIEVLQTASNGSRSVELKTPVLDFEYDEFDPWSRRGLTAADYWLSFFDRKTPRQPSPH